MRLRTGTCRALVTVLLVGTAGADTGGQTGHEVGGPDAADTFPRPSGPPVPDVEALGWEPVLDENFDGDELDESIWEIHEGPGITGAGIFTRDAVRVDDGQLTLSTYTEDGHHYTGEIRAGRDTEWFGQAGTYGYIEARVQLNNAQGTRSAFWMLSPTWHSAPFHDPAASGPEIDMFEERDPEEADSDPPDGECDYALLPLPCEELASVGSHWNAFGEDYTHLRQQVQWDGPPVQGNFLTYGLLWTPDGYRIFWDGREVAHSAEAITYRPEYIILTQHNWQGRAPDGGYGDIDETDTRMVVDHVRMWQPPVSHVPDQVVASDEALAVPFHVTDVVHGDPRHDHPRSVQVTATSSDQAVIPDENLVVTGNGPAEPVGSFTNGTFEDDSGWTFPDLPDGNSAHIWDGRALSGTRSLRLEQDGCLAQQTVTGLQPDTTYLMGSRYNLELEWDDANGDGRIDPDEGFPDSAGARADVDIEVVDTATGSPLDRISRDRNGWVEQDEWWSPHEDDWATGLLMFTTGPETSEITVSFENRAYAGELTDSNVSIDDVWLHPLVPPDRTLTALPAPDAVGPTTITLTATDETGTTLGTEDFVVTAGAGGLSNGSFEGRPAGAGWDLRGGADVLVEDPFRPDRHLELPGENGSSAHQDLTGLAPDTGYRVSFRGRVEVEGRRAGVIVQGHGGLVTGAAVTSTAWEEASFTFTTDGSGTAEMLALDLETGEGPSMIDDIRLTPVTGDPTGEPPDHPSLTDLADHQIPTSTPTALPFAPGATDVADVVSDHPDLVPLADVDVAGSDDVQVLGLTPVRDRTGSATLTFLDEQGAPLHEMTVDVVADELRNPGFEDGERHWDFSSGGSVVGGDTSLRGERALRLEPGDEVTQLVPGLAFNRDMALRGWSQGEVDLTVSTVADPGENDPTPYEEDFTATWSSGTWDEQEIRFTTTQCPACSPFGSHRADHRVGDGERAVTVSQGGQIEVTIGNSSGATAYVDELGLLHAPAIERIPEISLHEHQDQVIWTTLRRFSTGHIPADSWRDTDVVRITSSDEDVLPRDRIEVARSSFGGQANNGLSPARWAVEVRAASEDEAVQRTGRSDVTIHLTDPYTGLTNERTFTVTVNAGDNFANGDFERPVGLHEQCTPAGTSSWCHAGDNRSMGVVERQLWRYLGPHDHNLALRLSSGAAGQRITGLEPETDYVIRAEALGNGATSPSGDGAQLRVAATDGAEPIEGTTLAAVTLDAASWAPTPDLEFSTRPDETEVWLFVEMECIPDPEADGCQTVPESDRPCAIVADGEICIDNVALFRAADLN